MDCIKKIFLRIFFEIFPLRESLSIKKCEKKLNPLTGAAKTQRYIKNKPTHNLTPLPLRLHNRTGVSLRRFLPPFIDKKRNKTAEIQRHVKNNLSSPVRLFFFACVSLRYVYLYLWSAKQKNNTQRITPAVLKMRWWMLWYCHCWVFGAFLSSYAHFNIYSRKGTGGCSSLMILTFFVNDSLATMVANNINVTDPCTLRLIFNYKCLIKKEGPQNTQKDTEFFIFCSLYIFCVSSVFSVSSVGPYLL
jgi:hypothetical protein